MGENSAFLKEGQYVLGKRYRILQCIYRRPRLNLYLATPVGSFAPQEFMKQKAREQEPLVAIRELRLEGLPMQIRAMVETAINRESFSAAMPGSFLLGVGNRAPIEKDRHYLVMHPQIYAQEQRAESSILAQVLLQTEWPSWLTTRIIVAWGSQLCRSVARLHRLGVLFGNLSPATLLIDKEGNASRNPIQLISWPPAPQFWPEEASQANRYELYDSIFPIAKPNEENVFAAPELFQGACDERADVYSLGAILYLLLTHYAPASAVNRLSAMYEAVYAWPPACYQLEPSSGLELTLPRLMRADISPLLEQVLLRALDVKRERRYQTVFELVEALEALEQVEAQPNLPGLHKDESMRTLLRQIIGQRNITSF